MSILPCAPGPRSLLHLIMRNDYLQAAKLVVDDPYILVNVISHRVKQLRRGARSLVTSLEKLSFEDIALREVAEGKISYEYVEAPVEEVQAASGPRNITRAPR